MPRLPIFPLQIVVFPGEEVPLHIFEPRYRQLVRDMNDSGEPFGIALLRRGAQAEETHEIGCTVRIEQTEPFPDGRFNVMCRGEQRFRIIQRLDAAPYWIADVEFLDDPGDSESVKTPTPPAPRRPSSTASICAWRSLYRTPGNVASVSRRARSA